MTAAKETIQAMDDFQVVRFFEAFAQQLVVGTETPFDAIKGSIPRSIKALPGWEGIESLSPERAAQVMEPTTAVETTRTLLPHLAEDPTFGPLMDEFLASYRDDELVADVVLTVGLVATVLLMAAAIEFEGQEDGEGGLPRPALPLDRTVVLRDECLREGQAKTGTSLPTRHQRLKDPIAQRLGNPGAVVDDGDRKRHAMALADERDAPCDARHQANLRDGNGAAHHRLRGVAHDVENGLSELLPVRIEFGQAGVKVGDHLHLRAGEPVPGKYLGRGVEDLPLAAQLQLRVLRPTGLAGRRLHHTHC